MNEPIITVNGYPCSEAEAMTIHVALESFATDLVATGLGNDAHGKRMVQLYMSCIEQLRDKIFIHDERQR